MAIRPSHSPEQQVKGGYSDRECSARITLFSHLVNVMPR
jgi:hypothetical protein